MGGSSLARKLLIKPRQRILVLNPPQRYLDELGPLAEGVTLSEEPTGKFDFVHAFCKDSKELEKVISTATVALAPKGILWISYPKQSSKVKTDLNRDILWTLASEHGLKGVSLVSINDVWSAMRLTPFDDKK